MAIPNGIALERFPETALLPFAQREPGIIMAARFARQKDHTTLIEATALLKGQGVTAPVYLAGGGKAGLRSARRRLAEQRGVADQVHFLGPVPDLPQRLTSHQIFVLSTHRRACPWRWSRGMAAGCAARRLTWWACAA